MTQSEAAARLVVMAERGMPLRLVAEGDQQMLWRIAQAGPASAEPVPGAAAAVPLGQPPFGTPPPVTAQESPAQESPAQESPAQESPAQETPEQEIPEHQAPAEPTRRVLTSGHPTQSVTGGYGEELDVTLLQIIDPADQILASVGYRPDPGERSLLVQTSVGNRGSVDFGSLPDAHLILRDGAGTVLQKAALAVADYPAYQVGVRSHTLVVGWTVFLVPAETEVTEIRWSVRPEDTATAVVWTFGPA